MHTYPNEKLNRIAGDNYRILLQYCSLLEEEGYWQQPREILKRRIHDFLALYVQAMLVQLALCIGAEDAGTIAMIAQLPEDNPFRIDEAEGITGECADEARKLVMAPPILLQLCSLRDVENHSSMTGLFFDALLNILFSMTYLNGRRDAAMTRFIREYYGRIQAFVQNANMRGACVDEKYIFRKICMGELETNTEQLKQAGEDFVRYKREALFIEERAPQERKAEAAAMPAENAEDSAAVGREPAEAEPADGEEPAGREYPADSEQLAGENYSADREEPAGREYPEDREEPAGREYPADSEQLAGENYSADREEPAGGEHSANREGTTAGDSPAESMEPAIKEYPAADREPDANKEPDAEDALSSVGKPADQDYSADIGKLTAGNDPAESIGPADSGEVPGQEAVSGKEDITAYDPSGRRNRTDCRMDAVQTAEPDIPVPAAEPKQDEEAFLRTEEEKRRARDEETAEAIRAYRAKRLDKIVVQLEELTGLKGVKSEIHSLINLIRVRKMREAYHLPGMPMSYHMVFTGSPGTGKTTVARLISEIYRELGILSRGTMTETDRSGLVAGYVGQTALKVREVVDRAKGGVLFIDEAYTLCTAQGGNDFGGEAIDTLVKLMEDYREDLVVIVAGYTQEMEQFLKSNTGLISRFNKFIEFPDYGDGELLEILGKMAGKAGFTLDKGAREAVERYLEAMDEGRRREFGNARGIRNLFEKMVSAQADRVIGYERPTKEQLSELLEADCDFLNKGDGRNV